MTDNGTMTPLLSPHGADGACPCERFYGVKAARQGRSLAETMAAQINARNREIAALTATVAQQAARIAVLEEALRGVEWEPDTRLGADFCPACGNDRYMGHTEECILAAALHGPQGDAAGAGDEGEPDGE